MLTPFDPVRKELYDKALHAALTYGTMLHPGSSDDYALQISDTTWGPFCIAASPGDRGYVEIWCLENECFYFVSKPGGYRAHYELPEDPPLERIIKVIDSFMVLETLAEI